MIKVTYKEHEQVYTINVIYIRNDDNGVFMACRHNYGETNEWLFPKSNIIKIEKQVKDCTKEEIYKYLDYTFSMTDIMYIEIFDNSVYVVFYDGRTASFDDANFIDITDVVKDGL